jgi:hypothetical protein
MKTLLTSLAGAMFLSSLAIAAEARTAVSIVGYFYFGQDERMKDEFDYRRKGEPFEGGFQSPPVNWGGSSARKHAFFSYVAEITGSPKPAPPEGARSVVPHASNGASTAASQPAPAQTATAARLGELPAVKQRLAAGDATLKPALDALLSSADRALKVKPPSVTHKTKPAPSGSLHDYFSQAPYFWPDPASPNGLPYIAHDGRVNPESRTEASDQRRVETLGGTMKTLSLAYYFTGKEAYAAHAASCLRVWFLDPTTRMTPHMNYAQAVPGKNDGRGIGIIEAGGIVEAAEASGLLAGSPAWTAKDDADLKVWVAEFLDWLLTSKNGREEAAMKQNHGTMYDVRVMRLALMLGRSDLAKQIAEAAKEKRIAVQIEPDGRQPMELNRTKSFNYSRLNLTGLSALASLADRVGVDLWHYETTDGRSIRKAVDFMLPYVKNPPEKWPYQQIVSLNRSELAPVFRQAALAYHDPRYEEVVSQFPGIERASFQLSHPVPPRWPKDEPANGRAGEANTKPSTSE